VEHPLFSKLLEQLDENEVKHFLLGLKKMLMDIDETQLEHILRTTSFSDHYSHELRSTVIKTLDERFFKKGHDFATQEELSFQEEKLMMDLGKRLFREQLQEKKKHLMSLEKEAVLLSEKQDLLLKILAVEKEIRGIKLHKTT
jgi:hypothetical protein